MWFFHVATALCSLKNLCSFLFCTSSALWAFWSYISIKGREKKKCISQQKLLMGLLHDRHGMRVGEYITVLFLLGDFRSGLIFQS